MMIEWQWPESLSQWLTQVSIDVAILVLLVTTAQALFGRWLSPRWQYGLWCLVVLRVLLPGMPIVPGVAGWAQPLPADPASPSNVASSAADTDSTIPFGITGPPAFNSPRATQEPALSASSDSETEEVLIGGSVPSSSTTTPPTPVSTNPQLNWLWLWALGISTVLSVGLVRELRYRLLIRRHSEAAPAHLRALVDLGRDSLGMRRKVLIRTLTNAPAPAVCGLLRPRILIPAPLTTELSREDLQNVVLHELVHVKRHDVALNWLLLLLQSLHWFNPFVWYGFRRLHESRESLCDWQALPHTTSQQPGRYAQTLLRLVEQGQHLPPAPVVGFLRRPHEAKRRIVMITRFSSLRRSGTLLGLVLLLGIAWLALTATGHSNAEPKPISSPRSSVQIQVERQDQEPEWLPIMRQRLDQELTLKMDVEFSEAMNMLRQESGLNFIIAPEVYHDLQESHVRVLATHGVALRDILRQILPSWLEFGLMDGAIYIGEEGNIPESMDLRFYRIESLLKTTGRMNSDEVQDRFDQLEELIRRAVGGDNAWESDRVRLRCWNQILCVRQRDHLHAELFEFLNNLQNKGAGTSTDTVVENDHLRQVGERKISVEFEGITLLDAVRLLSSMHGIPILLNDDHADREVHLSLTDVPTLKVLEWLAQVAELHLGVRNGAFALDEQPIVRLGYYSVGDLIRHGARNHEDDDSREELADLLRDSVRPFAWDYNGVWIGYWDDLLIVSQSPSVHAEISRFLAGLRRVLKK